jgi:hypothetical protein
LGKAIAGLFLMVYGAILTLGNALIMDLIRHIESLDFDLIFALTGRAKFYLLRLGRAASHAIAAYMLLWLQPHFDFSFTALAIAVFFMSLPKRTLPVAEIILLLIAASIFVPVGFTQMLLNAIS